MRIVALILCIVSGVLLGVGMMFLIQKEQAPTPQVKPQVDAAMVKAEVEKVLKGQPELILDVLRKHDLAVFEVAQSGLNKKREKVIEAQRMQQLENPVKIDLAESRPIKGKANAPISIVEFSDFQCPHCFKGYQLMEGLMKQFPADVKLQFMHMPLKSHEHARIAAQYYEAAGQQDPEKAWKLHDEFFTNQDQLEEGGEVWIKETAAKLGLDMAKLEADAHSDAVRGLIEADLALAEKLDLQGTPTFFIGGVMVAGAAPMGEFVKVVELVKKHHARELGKKLGEEAKKVIEEKMAAPTPTPAQ